MARGEGGAASEDILDLPEAGPTVIRGGILRVLGFGTGVLISVGSAVILLRYLSVVDFGRYTQVFALVTIVAGLTDAGMTSIGVREYSVREGAVARTLLRNLLAIRLVLTVAGVGVALAFAVTAGYTRPMLAGLLLAGGALVLQVAQATASVPLQSGLRLGWITALDLLRQGGMALGLAAGVVGGAGLALLLAAPLPAAAGLLALTAWLMRGRVSLRPAFDWPTWRWLAAMTLPFAAATAVGVIYAYLTIVLMSLVASEQQTGIFSAAFRVFAVIAAIPGLLVMTAFPVLARAARDDRRRLAYAVQRLFEVCAIMGIGVALVVVVAAPTLIAVLAGPRYQASVGALRIQGVALLASFLVALGGFALLSLRRHRALLLANLAALLAAAGLTLGLAPAYGAVGTAYANLAGESVLVAGYFYALGRGAQGTRVVLTLAPRVLLAAAAGIAVALVAPGGALIAALLAAAAYAAALLALRAVPVEVFAALRRR